MATRSEQNPAGLISLDDEDAGRVIKYPES